MSRATIINLVTDYEDANMNTCKKSRDIEVVPRRIVEKIIERCESIRQDTECIIYPFDRGRNYEAKSVKQYAESLLEEFEGFEEDE